MQTFGVELLTVLGNAVFAPIARKGRPLAVVSGEANAYVDRAVSLVTRLNADADCNGIRLGASEIRKSAIEGWARTIFFMRLGTWWFPKAFPQFAPAFTSTHFPVAECWIVKTPVEVVSATEDEALQKVRRAAVVRASIDPTLLKDNEFFCRRLGVATRVK